MILKIIMLNLMKKKMMMFLIFLKFLVLLVLLVIEIRKSYVLENYKWI